MFEGIRSFETGKNASWFAMVECGADELVVGAVPVEGLGTPREGEDEAVRRVEVVLE